MSKNRTQWQQFAIFVALAVLLSGLIFCFLNYPEVTLLVFASSLCLSILWDLAGDMREMFK